MHKDQVQKLPDRGVLLAKSDDCPIAMFKVGRTALGIQAHPELASAYTEALLLDRVDRIGDDKVRAAQLTLNQPTDDALMITWISNFFRSLE